MKLSSTLLLLFITFISNGQIKDLSTLPAFDCSLKKIMTIIAQPTIIVSADNSVGLENITADYCGSLANNCVLKKEGDLTGPDLSKNLFIIGVLKDFRKWTNYNTPITLVKKGFVINHRKFLQSSDGLVFIDTNRIIIGGNSLKAAKDAQLAFIGGHDILITQNGKITFFGNKSGEQFNWFNLQDIKSTNYTKRSSPLFSAIYVSKTFKQKIDYAKLDRELRSYVTQFLSIYNIEMPVVKNSWFIHSNIMEYGMMSGLFRLTCPGNNSAGFSIRGEIHTNGFNTGLLKHEYSHFLFDNSISQEYNPAFFVEGCVEYVTNINDISLYKQRVSTAKKYKDSLNYTDLLLHNKDFYGRYSEANYSICGVLTKYIIDNFGVTSFKKYCLAKNKTVSTNEIFKMDFDEFTNGYKTWLDKQ